MSGRLQRSLWTTIFVFCICLPPAALEAQVRSGAGRRSEAISRRLDVVLGRLGGCGPSAPTPIRPCRPRVNLYQMHHYWEPPVSYLSSSPGAYNFSSPPPAPSAAFVHNSQSLTRPSASIEPAREWGLRSPTVFGPRQIPDYAPIRSSEGGPSVFVSRQSSGTGAAKKQSEIASAALETARAIGVAMGRGDKAFERGLYDEARAEYAKALLLSDDDATARLSMGMAAFAQGQYLDAAEAVHEAVLTAPPSVIERFDIRRLFGPIDGLELHRARLQQQAELGPRPELHLLAGFIDLRTGTKERAARHLRSIDRQSSWGASAEMLSKRLK